MVQATTAVILHAGAAKIVQSYLHAMFSLKDQNDGCGKGSTQHWTSTHLLLNITEHSYLTQTTVLPFWALFTSKRNADWGSTMSRTRKALATSNNVGRSCFYSREVSQYSRALTALFCCKSWATVDPACTQICACHPCTTAMLIFSLSPLHLGHQHATQWSN